MKCDGYASLTKSNNERQGRETGSPACNPPAATSSTPLDITAYAIPFQIPGSQKDRQMLHYFCVQACHDLSGYLSSEFWSRVVLQCSHTEPVVRHALVALSSIHLEYATRESPGIRRNSEGTHDVQTLLQYNRAVRQLRRYLSTTAEPSIKIALTCCALFYCFESARGDYDSAREHLESGLAILQIARANSADRKPSGDPSDSHGHLEQLSRIFSRLDLQASMFDDARTPFLQLTSADERSGVKPAVPQTVFSNLEEARVTLDKLQNHLFNFLTRNNHYKFVSAENLPELIVREKYELGKQSERWSVAFEEFLQPHSEAEAGNQHPRDPELKRKLQEGTTILRIHHRLSQMFLSASFPEDISIFGASPNLDAEFILEWAESLVHSNRSAVSALSPPSRSFSSEMGIVAPLFLLAMKCYDVHVCEKAVALLAVSNRREGLIDAPMVLGILSRVAMLKRNEEITPLIAEAARRSSAPSAEETPLEVWAAEAIETTTGGLQGIARMLDVSS